MLRLDRLRAFLVFADTANFSEAARRLNLSQPALHAQVGQLADEVGAPLYRRQGRGVVLTQEGRQLAAFARELDERTERFLDQVHGRASNQPVVLCAGEASTRALLLPLIRDRPPVPPLRLLVGNAARTTEAVASGEAHLGFTVAGSLPDSVLAEPVLTLGTIAAVPEDHPLARATRLTPADLAGVPLIVPPPTRPHRLRLDAILPPSPTIAAEVQGWELAVELAAAGLGIALVNDFVALPEGAVAVPFDGLPPVTYSLLRRTDAPSVPAIDALADAIRALDTPWSD